jgi:nucleotide-binding universal stress UspA family protein
LNSLRTSLQVTVRHILFATDFSAAADRALPYAVVIARRSNATIHAVHVIVPDADSPSTHAERNAATDAGEFLAQKNNQLESELRGIPHENLFLRGDIWRNLENVIETRNVDLVVLGTHGQTGIAKGLLGSVAEKILRQALCAVLTVGTAAAQGAGRARITEINCILYATNFSPASLGAARHAISLAKDHGAKLILLHSTEELIADQEALALEILKNVVPLGAGLPSQPAYIMGHGDPADAILQAAKAAHADLIVIGAHGVEKHHSAATRFSTSIAGRLVANAGCPVLTVHR